MLKIKSYDNYLSTKSSLCSFVPEGWQAIRLKNLVNEHYAGLWGDDESGDENDIKCLRVADFDFTHMTYKNVKTIRNVTPDKRLQKKLKNPSILLEKSGGGAKTPVGRAILFDSNEEMVCANFIDVLRLSKKVDYKFVTYLFYAAYNIGLNWRSIKQNTGIQNLDTKSFFSEIFPIPPHDTQIEIVKYLDSKISDFDSNIQLLKKKKKRYLEFKQSLISEVSSKGLSKKAELKDSGIEWVGDVPQEWSVERLGDKFELNKTKNTDLKEKNLLSLSYGNVIRKDIESNFGLLPASFDGYQIVEPGYIILRLTDLQNDKKSLRVGLVKERGIITSAYVGLRLSKEFYPGFIYYVLHSYDLKKVFYWHGGSLRQSMGYNDIKVLKVAYPDYETQKQIANYLDEKTIKINELVNAIDRQIATLQEFRKTLINDVVTGKVKVT